MWTPWAKSLNQHLRHTQDALDAALTDVAALAGQLNASRPEALTEPLRVEVQVLTQDLDALRTFTESELEVLRAAAADLQAKHIDHTIAIASGIAQVERAENRVKAVIRRAQARLANEGVDDPAVEAEAREFFGGDAPGGVEPELPTVPAGVGQPDPTTGRIKGIPGKFPTAR